MNRVLFVLFFFSFVFLQKTNAQDISLFQQFNGRYDYLAVGNTLNQAENNISQGFCEILPSSDASLNLPASTNIIAAYLYWSGSGTGDTEVQLNAETITAEDTYIVEYDAEINGILPYFACYANVTNQIITEGNVNYQFSGLDLSDTLTNTPGYCNIRTNYAGWSLYVVYEDSTLPLNQVNLFQGLEIINRDVQDKTIILNNVNVLDNDNAKIGFLAWEGDNALNFGESLSINGNTLSNPPLNLPDNAFNGTNSFTNATDFYNADLDVYNIENNIQIGDTQVEISLTTGALDSNGIFQADLIIINNIITVLNSQLPDATIVVNTVEKACANRLVTLNFTVSNYNSTDTLPANTPIAFYIDGVLIAQSQTENDIPISGQETYQINIEVPANIPDDFILQLVVDDDGTGIGIVTETTENNNDTFETIQLIPLPQTITLAPILNCDEGFDTAIFDLSDALLQVDQTQYLSFDYFVTLDDISDNNPILNPSNYQSNITPQSVFITAETDLCFDIFQFELLTENCPPHVPQGFSPNYDSFNDYFNIQGLYTIFQDHELYIYNRFGTLIFIGNDDLKWEGQVNQGLTNKGEIVPTGTYFYILKLNDNNYQDLTGWVYLNK